MSRVQKARRTATLASLAGMGLFIGLIAYNGFFEIAGAISAARTGLLWIGLYHLVPLAVFAVAWGLLLGPEESPGLPALLRWRWIGESVNNLMPVAQVGGDLVRAQLAARAGVTGPVAAASVVADVTAGILTELIFAAAGITLLLWNGSGPRVLGLLIGLGILAILILGFFLVQRSGMFRILARLSCRLFGKGSDALLGHATAADASLRRIYGRRGRFLTSSVLRLGGWMLGVGEIWLTCWFLGRPVSVTEALVLESLAQTFRSAGFLVPGGIGVQEGGIVLTGSLLQVEPEMALSISLVKRMRELVLGIPGLLVWQLGEGSRLVRPWQSRRNRQHSSLPMRESRLNLVDDASGDARIGR